MCIGVGVQSHTHIQKIVSKQSGGGGGGLYQQLLNINSWKVKEIEDVEYAFGPFYIITSFITSEESYVANGKRL